jgi:DnaK suppressor protein
MSIATRAAELRHILNTRRREAQDDIHARVRSTRSDRRNEVRDYIEHSDAGTQGDIELTLAQMSADTLSRIDHALARLDAGHYGRCVDCAHEIAERRLRVLPFAVRCQACEEHREQEHGRRRRLAQKGGSLSLFPDTVSP